MNIELLVKGAVLFCAGIAIVGFFIGFIILQINKKKGLIAILLAVVFSMITLYYAYLFFFPLYSPFKVSQNQNQPSIIPPVNIETPLMVVFETEDGSQIIAEDGDSLEVKKDVKIKASKVTKNNTQIENVRINVIGFTPSENPSTNDDTGYWFTYKNMQKRFAVDDEKVQYKIEIKKGDEKLAEVFIKFI